MQDKSILITGGNDGIGKATAQALAQRGARVVLACRNLEKGKKAARDIREQTGNQQVETIECDLSSFHSIRTAAASFRPGTARLDVLINNAGLYSSHLQKTAEGIELQFGVNHIGHFLLTHLLLDSLQAAPAPRVVNVSSIAYLQGKIDFDNLKGEKPPGQYGGMKAYARSKLANVLFTREFARRYPGIDCNALHPGGVGTNIGNKEATLPVRLFWSLWKLFALSPADGAKTSVFLASAPEARGVSGQFFDQHQRKRKLSETARNDALAQRLWEVSMDMVAPALSP